MDITTIIQELIDVLGSTNLSTDLATVQRVATQILAFVGDKNAERDIQAQDAYNAALAGSVTAAQYLLHNSDPNSGMPHEDIVRGQFYWSELLSAGWTSVNGTATPPVKPVQ